MVPQTKRVAPIRREADCPLRDGTKLHTVLLTPEGDGPWPALLTRHPYDVSGDESAGRVDLDRFVAAGYLVALQDVRGRFGSQGEFDASAQEVADGADAVAWLASLAECSGVVGMFGASYASETQFSALAGGSPALRAIIPAVTPVASGTNGFRFRGGVPEVGSMFAWSHFAIAPGQIARISDPDERTEEERRWLDVDRLLQSGELFRAGTLQSSLEADATLRWMRERLSEPLDSPAHSVGKVTRIGEVDIPVFLIGGWFDVFLGSTLTMYRALLTRARTLAAPEPYLLIGPWSHTNMTGVIGDLDFGAEASDARLDGLDMTDQHLRFFDAALQGSSSLDGVAPVRVFVMGANRWLELPEFPPAQAQQQTMMLGADAGLRSSDGTDGVVTFTSDPGHPVPTRGGATLLFPPYEPGPSDQREIENRSDVVSWRTEPLDDDLAVVGEIRAVIHLAVDGTDADLVVRLCDEHPDGSTIVIADGIQRGSARAVDATTGQGPVAPVRPHVFEEYDVDLWATAHAFLRGHRVRVDITSSSSPRWDVGSNAFPPADPGTTELAATYTVGLGPAHPSRLLLSVLPRTVSSSNSPTE
ncbi:CocE/NonD family hydrolase [Subtercola sp. YIM 133946]|uniref:CocE/NonD family hydrolase n=1 Tax=Subtercola sp. YIM 133946 TaxID=3118909 RepID=UPI002F93EC4D